MAEEDNHERLLHADFRVKAILNHLRINALLPSTGTRLGYQQINDYCCSPVIPTYLCDAELPRVI